MSSLRDGRDSTVVRVDPKTRQVITGVLLGIMAVLVIAAGVSQTRLARRPRPPAFAAGVIALAIVGGTLAILRITRSRVALEADSIEIIRYPWPRRRLAATDVIGRYFSVPGFQRPGYHVLVTRDGGQVKLPPYLESSGTLRAWLAAIPLLSARQRKDGRFSR